MRQLISSINFTQYRTHRIIITMSFDQYVESLDNVPPELERNFALITKLDKNTAGLIKKVNHCIAKYSRAKHRSERLAIRQETAEIFEKLHSFADDKIELAKQTYEVIDKNITKLTDLGKGKASTSSQAATTTDPSGNPVEREALIGFDMPLDPNEPTYCLCRGVSHGDMIACDNFECPIEWFHYSCVNLARAPKGKWYCGQCFNLPSIRKKQSKRRR